MKSEAIDIEAQSSQTSPQKESFVTKLLKGKFDRPYIEFDLLKIVGYLLILAIVGYIIFVFGFNHGNWIPTRK